MEAQQGALRTRVTGLAHERSSGYGDSPISAGGSSSPFASPPAGREGHVADGPSPSVLRRTYASSGQLVPPAPADAAARPPRPLGLASPVLSSGARRPRRCSAARGAALRIVPKC